MNSKTINNSKLSDNEELIEAWKEASKELGIEIETPFFLQMDGRVIKYDLLIKNFGSKNGTLILTTNETNEYEIAEKLGFYYSALNPYHYSKYDKELFIDTLTDWGYFGIFENKPDWYTGHI